MVVACMGADPPFLVMVLGKVGAGNSETNWPRCNALVETCGRLIVAVWYNMDEPEEAPPQGNMVPTQAPKPRIALWQHVEKKTWSFNEEHSLSCIVSKVADRHWTYNKNRIALHAKMNFFVMGKCFCSAIENINPLTSKCPRFWESLVYPFLRKCVPVM